MLLWRMTGILINWLKFQIWQTSYYHIVNSQEGLIEWYKGSGLRPYLEMLENDGKNRILICATERIRKAITNTKIRQSNSKNAKIVLYFAEKMIDFEKSDYIVGLF